MQTAISQNAKSGLRSNFTIKHARARVQRKEFIAAIGNRAVKAGGLCDEYQAA
jgi:hypothetical protein